MKAIKIVTVIMFLAVIASSCKPTLAEGLIILEGEHELRKLIQPTGMKQTPGHISGGFFFGIGGLSGTGETIEKDTTVTFAWRMHDGSYAISTLPVTKIRVKPVSKTEVASISFGTWGNTNYWCDTDITETLMTKCVKYAVITCRDEDWPFKIQLPLNQVK